MGIIAFIILGLIAGAIAKALLPGDDPGGFIITMIIGVAGALIGGFLATEVLNIADNDEFDFGSFLIAVGTSLALLLLYLRFQQRRTAY